MAPFSIIGLLLFLSFLVMSYVSLNHFSPLIFLSLLCLISYIRQFWLIHCFFLLPFLSIYRLQGFVICVVLFLRMFFLSLFKCTFIVCRLYFIMIEKKGNKLHHSVHWGINPLPSKTPPTTSFLPSPSPP